MLSVAREAASKALGTCNRAGWGSVRYGREIPMNEGDEWLSESESGGVRRVVRFPPTWGFCRHFCAPGPVPPALASQGSTHRPIDLSMARDIDPGLTQTAIRRSPPAHNHGCGSWVCPCHGVDISVSGRGCGLGDAFRTRDRAQTPRHSLGFLLRTWWRGASTRAVADVGSSSNSRSGIEYSGSPCAP